MRRISVAEKVTDSKRWAWWASTTTICALVLRKTKKKRRIRLTIPDQHLKLLLTLSWWQLCLRLSQKCSLLSEISWVESLFGQRPMHRIPWMRQFHFVLPWYREFLWKISCQFHGFSMRLKHSWQYYVFSVFQGARHLVFSSTFCWASWYMSNSNEFSGKTWSQKRKDKERTST